jgi:hypothetical protein
MGLSRSLLMSPEEGRYVVIIRKSYTRWLRHTLHLYALLLTFSPL